MAAGKGTRMLPITESVPKVLIPIGGVPFLKLVIQRLQEAGITDIGIVTSYKSEMVKAFLDEEGIKATIIDQGEPLGTGHAIKVTRDFVNGENFVALGGDNLWSVHDIQSMIKEDDEWYVAAWTVTNPEKYGVLICEKSKLKKIVEKPKTRLFVNTGLYIMKPKILNLIPKKRFFHMTQLIELVKKKKYSVAVYPIGDKDWIDMGELSSYNQHIDFQEKKIFQAED